MTMEALPQEKPLPSRYYSTANDSVPCCGTSSSNCVIKE